MSLPECEIEFRKKCTSNPVNVDKLIGIDFEFRNSTEKYHDLVCCVAGKEKFWLWKNEAETKRLCSRLKELSTKGYTLLCYSQAEMDCFLSMGLEPTDFSWIDLMVEFKMCKNECALAQYGRQLQVTKKSKKFVYSEIPTIRKKDMDDETKKLFTTVSSNKLVVALAKYCWDVFDIAHADEKEAIVMPVIVEGTEEILLANKQRILDYCQSDVDSLQLLAQRMLTLQRNLYEDAYEEVDVVDNAIKRGAVVAEYSKIRERGIPIHRQWATQIGNEAQNLIAQIAREVNEKMQPFIDELPDDKPAFKKAKKEGFITFDVKKRQWSSGRGLVLDAILEKNYDYLCESIGQEWPRTDKGKVSANKDFVKKLLSDREPRTLVETALAFGPKTSVIRKLDLHGSTEFEEVTEFEDELTNDYQFDSRSFWGAVSKSDFRSRSPFFPFTTQSSRCAPSTTGSPILLPKWLRTIMQPEKGKVIVDVDFSSQETLLQAIWAQDEALLEAYRSGDIYIATGKQFGILPPDAVKKKFPLERQALKAIVLGLGFGMGQNSLNGHIKNELGAEAYAKLIKKLEDQGMDTNFWQMFQDAYPELAQKKKQVMQDKNIICQLPVTSYTMWSDNPNPLSKTNVFVQGLAASILYECVKRMRDLPIVWTLHDAIAFEVDLEGWEETANKILSRMLRAFDDVCKAYTDWELIREGTGIRAEIDVYGYGLECGVRKSCIGTEIRTSPCFVDPRGVADTLAYGLTAFPEEDFFRYVLPTCEMHNPKLVDKWRQSLDYWHYALSVL